MASTDNNNSSSKETRYYDRPNKNYNIDKEFDEINEPERQETTPKSKKTVVKKAEDSKWKKVAISGTTGILLGAAGAMLTSFTPADEAPEPEPEPNPDSSDIAQATGVNDNMSFSEAFATARAEVGPGGVFEWHGGLYGTYYANEWDSMSTEDRAEYYSHFSWGDNADVNATSNDLASNHTSTSTSSHYDNTDDIEIVEANDWTYENTTEPIGEEAVDPDLNLASTTSTAENDIEIVEVLHDDESGMNLGEVIIDNQEVVFIDVDNDYTFEAMAIDANNNGQLDDGELIDISQQGLTVNDLGGFTDPTTDPTGDLYASNDVEIDYTNDTNCYEG